MPLPLPPALCSTLLADSYPLQLQDSDEVLMAILRALWAVCNQLYNLMNSERTGRHSTPTQHHHTCWFVYVVLLGEHSRLIILFLIILFRSGV